MNGLDLFSWTYFVALKLTNVGDNGKFQYPYVGQCGGTIIANRLVLTAGHCCKDKGSGKIATKIQIRVK